MDETNALACLSALSQPTRLAAFRLLVAREPVGVAAGEIARLVDVPQNTMSTHLAMLAQCGLAMSQRHSRSIVYRADLDHFRALLLFLLQDCCGGRPEICAPVLGALTAAGAAPCCPPAKSQAKRASAKRTSTKRSPHKRSPLESKERPRA